MKKNPHSENKNQLLEYVSTIVMPVFEELSNDNFPKKCTHHQNSNEPFHKSYLVLLLCAVSDNIDNHASPSCPELSVSN